MFYLSNTQDETMIIMIYVFFWHPSCNSLNCAYTPPSTILRCFPTGGNLFFLCRYMVLSRHYEGSSCYVQLFLSVPNTTVKVSRQATSTLDIQTLTSFSVNVVIQGQWNRLGLNPYLHSRWFLNSIDEICCSGSSGQRVYSTTWKWPMKGWKSWGSK